MERMNGDYFLTDDKSRLDIDAIHALLRHTYWAEKWPRSLIERFISGSACFSVFHQGRQIAFARAISDHVTFTYLCDVVVHPDHRGRGLGQWLVKCVLEHPDLQTLTYVLRTRDAHGLYEKFGFQRVEYMRRSRQPA